MNIEAIVKKRMGHHYGLGTATEAAIRNALTELAAEYEQRIAEAEDIHIRALVAVAEELQREQERIHQLSETHAIELRAYEATVENQAERIRQLEAELEQVRCASLAVCRRFDNFNSDVVSDSFGSVHPMKIQESRERLIASLRELYEMAAAPQPKKEGE